MKSKSATRSPVVKSTKYKNKGEFKSASPSKKDKFSLGKIIGSGMSCIAYIAKNEQSVFKELVCIKRIDLSFIEHKNKRISNFKKELAILLQV